MENSSSESSAGQGRYLIPPCADRLGRDPIGLDHMLESLTIGISALTSNVPCFGLPSAALVYFVQNRVDVSDVPQIGLDREKNTDMNARIRFLPYIEY